MKRHIIGIPLETDFSVRKLIELILVLKLKSVRKNPNKTLISCLSHFFYHLAKTIVRFIEYNYYIYMYAFQYYRT